MAETTGSATEKRTYQKKYSQEELNAAVDKAVAEAMKKISQPQTIVQVAKEEYVTLLYLGAKAKGTVVAMPGWGTITIEGGTLDVPKKDFLHGLGVQTNDALIRKRKILVINGLTKEERVRFGVDYKDGEVLTSEAFGKLTELPKDKICSIYEKLCDEHKKLVATVFHREYFYENKKLDTDTVKQLNALSKTVAPEGLFTPILENMGEKLIE